MNSADMQEAVQEEVNSRMAKAQQDLVAKYARGEGGQETSVEGPTGQAYKEKHIQEMKKKKAQKENHQSSDRNQEPQHQHQQQDDDNDDEDEDDDDDPELRAIKQQRLKQIKEAHMQKLENIGKGHGQYREITQDEFIGEMTTSMKTICCFYHKDFPRCEIMHHHLYKLAQRHIEAKFVKIDAEKSPFFIEKLKIRTMPTVVIFDDGVAKDKIIGFEELADNMPEGKEDEWPTIVLARLLAAKGAISSGMIVDDDEAEAKMKAQIAAARRDAYMSATLDDLDDDFEDD